MLCELTVIFNPGLGGGGVCLWWWRWWAFVVCVKGCRWACVWCALEGGGEGTVGGWVVGGQAAAELS